MAGEVKVAAGDIARLAGVGRAAVSNWRRRFADFPRPVGGTSANPLFSMAEVESWLRAQGKLAELPEDERTWQQIRNAVDDLHLAELVSALAAFVATPGHRQRLGESDAELAGAMPDGLRARLGDACASLLRSAAALAARRGPADAVEFLYGRYVETHSRRVQIVAADVAAIMAEVLGPCESVLDPLCGFGPLLLAAAPKADRLLGQERDPAAAGLAAARLAGRGSVVEMRVGDALTADGFPGVEVDGALCVPPYHERGWGYERLTNDPRWLYGLPPRGEAELAWVQHCLARLRPGGRAVVLMPPAAANRRSGRRIRSRLLRTGTLRAVIALPGGAAPQSALPPHLWVLRRTGAEDEPPARVLMADCELGEVVTTWEAFVRGMPLKGAARAVPVIDLLDDEIDLTPAAHLPAKAPIRLGHVEQARRELAGLGSELTGLIPAVREGAREPAVTTLGDLARTGAVHLEQTPIRVRTEPGDTPMLTVQDVTAGRGPTGRGNAEPGAVVAFPGDIVIPALTGTAVARIVEEEVTLGPNLLLIRADPEILDAHFLAGLLRLAAPRGRLSGSSRRVDVRRVRVPRLPVAEQRRYGETFRRLEEFEDALGRLTDNGRKLITVIREGLIHGELRPGA